MHDSFQFEEMHIVVVYYYDFHPFYFCSSIQNTRSKWKERMFEITKETS